MRYSVTLTSLAKLIQQIVPVKSSLLDWKNCFCVIILILKIIYQIQMLY